MAVRKKKSGKKHVNLLPQKEFESSSYGRILKWVLTTFRYIVVLVELVVISGFLSRFVLDVRNTDLADGIKRNQSIIESFSEFESDFREAQFKLSTYNQFADSTQNGLTTLQLIASSLPDGVRLTSLQKDVSGTLVRGESLEEVYVLQFLANLKAKGGLEDANLVSVESTFENPLVNFEISITPTIQETDGS